ncbi:hypothetical protein HZA45_02370 [Candidatus Peregrinibacteria bacterium]|nr:hypothetical protein [Candidatus Peregrinibacteria bacterium]
MAWHAHFRQDRIIGGAAVLAVTQLSASVVGLVLRRVLAATFPELAVVDVYIAAFRPSDLLFQVGIMSAMGTVLVPLLAGHKAHGRGGDVDRVLSGTMLMGSVLFGVFALLLAVAFPWVAPYMVHFRGDELALYIQFGRIALLTNFLFVFGNAFGQYLITEQRYWVYGITPIVYTLGTIAGTIFLTQYVGPYGPIVGTVGGAFLYTVLRFGGALARGFRFRATLWHPDLSEMGILMLPRMLALGAMQLQLLLFDTIASGLDTGSVTINAFTRDFQGVIVGVAGVALSQSAYSLLSQAAAKKEFGRFRIYVDKGLLMLLLFTIPASFVLVGASPIAAGLVKLSHVLHPFTLALILYALSIPFESINHLFLRGFYALKDTVIPAVLGVTTGMLAVLLAWIFAPQYGVFALPFGYTIGQVIETVVMGMLLMRRIKKLQQ